MDDYGALWVTMGLNVMGNEVVIGSCDEPLYNKEPQRRWAFRLHFGLCLLELPLIARHITFKDKA